MNDLFKKDITIKIISVLAAVLLWLYVYNTSDNPYSSKTFTNIPLKLENIGSLDEKGLEIKNNYKTSIDITVRGRQDAIDKVRDSDFEAILDFSRINSANDRTLEIIGPTCTQKDVTIVSYNPNIIDISVAKIKNNAFPVEIIPNVTLKPGYKIIKITPNVETITLQGEEAVIDSVETVSAALDIKDLDRNITKRVACKVFNKEGREIPSLSKNLSVEVKIEVAKEVPITLVVNGTPNKEYVEVLRSISPDKARITGTPELLAEINELKTEPISIENITKDLNVTGIIKLPNGIKLADQPKEISVNIVVEPLVVKDFTIALSDIGIQNANNDGTMTYEIKTESVKAGLKGRSSVLNALTVAGLRPTIDVSGLPEGVQKVPLSIILPSGVTLIQEVPVEIKITKVQVPG